MKSKWEGKRVLITGADGFIGSHLTEQLKSLGALTNAFVQYNSWGSIGCLEEVEKKDDLSLFFGDVRDKSTLYQAMKDVDVVFHLAALISIPYSYQAPEAFIKTNIEGTLNVLQVALDSKVKTFVHTSSRDVYGAALYNPVDEKHPLQALSPYAASKIAGEKLVESFHHSFGLGTVVVRPFNTYGPRQSTRAIIPSIIFQLSQSSRIKLGNLHPTRDFNYVLDVVNGFIKAGSSPNAIGKTINLGSGQEISIQALAEKISGLMNKKIVIEHESKRSRSNNKKVDRLVANHSLAKDILGWTSQSSLDEGLKHTINWFLTDSHSTRSNALSI